MSIIFPVIAYLVGAIPFGLIFSKMAGIDVRREGSKNIGATNVGRVLGKKLGFLTLGCDVLKGLLPMIVATYFLPEEEGKEVLVAMCGILAVLGHMFPVYLAFKGGKGVATGLGVFLFLSPWAVLISVAVFFSVVALFGYVSLGSLTAAALIPLWIWLTGGTVITIVTAGLVALLIWVKHYENIIRLAHGEEKSWKKGKQ